MKLRLTPRLIAVLCSVGFVGCCTFFTRVNSASSGTRELRAEASAKRQAATKAAIEEINAKRGKVLNALKPREQRVTELQTRIWKAQANLNLRPPRKPLRGSMPAIRKLGDYGQPSLRILEDQSRSFDQVLNHEADLYITSLSFVTKVDVTRLESTPARILTIHIDPPCLGRRADLLAGALRAFRGAIRPEWIKVVRLTNNKTKRTAPLGELARLDKLLKPALGKEFK